MNIKGFIFGLVLPLLGGIGASFAYTKKIIGMDQDLAFLLMILGVALYIIGFAFFYEQKPRNKKWMAISAAIFISVTVITSLIVQYICTPLVPQI